MTTLADIGLATGVSSAVVSRVVNRDPNLRISASTRERVLRAIEEHGYAPNVAARSLRSSRSGIVAAVVNDVANPVYSEIIRGAQSAAGKAKRALLLGDLSCGPESAAHLADLISGNGVDGLIIQAAGGMNDNLLVRAARRNLPVVLLQSRLELKAHLVMLPDRAAAAIATTHVLGLGHRKIGCVATHAGLTFTEARRSGWETALNAADVPVKNCPFVHAGSTINDGHKAAAELLDQNPGLTALISFNVLAAIGALDQARERGLAVPRDISIVALHDIDLAAHLNPPLTTVAMPLFEMGRRAVEILCCAESDVSGRTVIQSPPPKLICRSSTGAPTRKAH